MTTLSEAIASAVAAELGQHRESAAAAFTPGGNDACCLCGWIGRPGLGYRAHLSIAIAATVAAVVEAERAEDRARLAAVEGLLAAYGEESADEFLVYQLRAALDVTTEVAG